MESVNKNRYLLTDSVLLIVLVAAVYGRILGHDFLSNWDDNWCVLGDESIRGFSWGHLRTAFSSNVLGSYVPAQTVTYMLDYTIWGFRASGFLLTNIILHTACGILAYALFIRWYKDRMFALVASTVFLIHPVQVESVAWITQRRTPLAMLFFLLAWEFYCRYRQASSGKGWFTYGASVAAFAIALLAKSIAVIFPVTLILYDICFPEGGRRLRLRDKIPFILAAGVIAAVNMHVQAGEAGARVGFHGGSPLATFFTMLPVFCRYLGMLVWPTGLSAMYAPPIYTTPETAVVGAALLLCGVVLAGALLFRRDRKLGYWVIFFFIGLFPVSQIVPISFIMSDRYLYFPMLGVAGLAGAGAVALRDRMGTRRRMLAYTLLAMPLLALSIASFQQAGVWRNALTLWSNAVVKEPTSDRAWELFGEANRLEGNTEAAFRAYERGLALNPTNPEILYGLGELYTNGGELEKGYVILKKLLELKPKYVIGWSMLGNNYLKRGDYIDAEKAYKHALALQPDAMPVLALLGDLELTRRDFGRARSYYGQVEAKGWNDPYIAYQLACVEAQTGRKDAALEWLEKALQRGYNDLEKLVNDGHLASIRGEPRFRNLLSHYGLTNNR